MGPDIQEESLDRRLRARRALENLVDSNGPDIVEDTSSKEPHDDDLRCEVRSALEQALDTGSLAMALQVHERQQDQQDSLDPDFLRMQARRALGSISSQDIEGVCQKAIEMSTGT